MEQITSVTNLKIKNLLALRKKIERYNEHKFLVEGLHLTIEAYKNNFDVVLTGNGDFDSIIEVLNFN